MELELSHSEAQNLTDRIRQKLEETWTLIQQAYHSKAWKALGYSSWDDYCTTEFADSRLRLPRGERREIVSSLHSSGMSQRAISSVLGADPKTVRNDLRELGEIPSPDNDPYAQAKANARKFRLLHSIGSWYISLNIAQMIHEGLSIEGFSEVSGISQERIRFYSYAWDEVSRIYGVPNPPDEEFTITDEWCLGHPWPEYLHEEEMMLPA